MKTTPTTQFVRRAVDRNHMHTVDQQNIRCIHRELIGIKSTARLLRSGPLPTHEWQLIEFKFMHVIKAMYGGSIENIQNQ
jgi:hypothetical protein